MATGQTDLDNFSSEISPSQVTQGCVNLKIKTNQHPFLSHVVNRSCACVRGMEPSILFNVISPTEKGNPQNFR